MKKIGPLTCTHIHMYIKLNPLSFERLNLSNLALPKYRINIISYQHNIEFSRNNTINNPLIIHIQLNT